MYEISMAVMYMKVQQERQTYNGWDEDNVALMNTINISIDVLRRDETATEQFGVAENATQSLNKRHSRAGIHRAHGSNAIS